MGEGGLTMPSPVLSGANQDYQAWRNWQNQNMAAHPDLAKVLEHINNALQIGGLGMTLPTGGTFAGPASRWPQTPESAGKILMPVQRTPEILDIFLGRRLAETQGAARMTPDDMKHILELLGMK